MKNERCHANMFGRTLRHSLKLTNYDTYIISSLLSHLSCNSTVNDSKKTKFESF